MAEQILNAAPVEQTPEVLVSESTQNLINKLKEAIESDPILKTGNEFEIFPSQDGLSQVLLIRKPVSLVAVSTGREGQEDGFYVYADPVSDAALAVQLGLVVGDLGRKEQVGVFVAGVCSLRSESDGIKVVYDTEEVYSDYATILTSGFEVLDAKRAAAKSETAAADVQTSAD